MNFLRLCTLVLVFTWPALSSVFADTNLSLAKAPETALTNLLAIRAKLDKVTANSKKLSGEELLTIKKATIKLSDDLANEAGAFTDKFTSQDYCPQLIQQAVYGTVLRGMLDKAHSVILGNLAVHISSCLFQSETCKNLSVSPAMASQLQSIAEESFADAVIIALKFEPESFNGIFVFLQRARADVSRKLAHALLDSSAPDETLKNCALFVLNRKFSIGQPISLKFDAMDGKRVDVAELRGKVVLIDFWGTYCLPCMSQLPELKSLYQEFHGEGFEIVGISMDSEQKKVAEVIQEKVIPWPNFVSEKGQTNEFAMAFGVSAPPNYWLIDRKGIVREIMADSNLKEKIKFLLAESP